MTYLAEHIVTGAGKRSSRSRRSPAVRQPAPIGCRDQRWPALAAALATMREARRCSVRIIDADCGSGTMLVCAARYARALGFTAIEAHGIDRAPALVARARIAAAAIGDPAIGLSFAVGDVVGALEREAEFPADIVVWHGCGICDAAVTDAVAAAGRTLIADAAPVERLAA